MFCKNCANQLDDVAVVCVRCGAPRGQGIAYCQNCAAPTPQGAVVCTTCGAALVQPIQGEQKSKIAAGLLGIFLGSLGVHNFYLGFTGKAIAQLLISILSLGFLSPLSAIWGLIEGVLILTGSMNKDAKGVPLKD